MSFSQEQPPESVEEILREYLGRRFIDVAQNFRDAPKFPKRHGMPYKPQFGDIQQFGDPATHQYDAVITGAGWWGFMQIYPVTDPATGVWRQLATEKFVVDNFVVAGYGGVKLDTPAALSDIDSTWQTLPADSAVVGIPKYVTQDFAQDGVIIIAAGIWQVAANIAISHNELNAGREMQLRLLNVDTGVPGAGVTFGTGRNVGITNMTATVLFDMPEIDENDLFVLQVNSALDTYSLVTLESYNFSVVHVSNAQFAEVS